MKTLFQTTTPTPTLESPQGFDAVSIILLVGGIAAAVTAVLSVWKTGRDLLLRTIFKKVRTYRLLGRLVTGATLLEFSRILGAPTFRRRLATGHDEIVYVSKHFYVRAVAGADEAILFYAVTSRRQRFYPPLWGGRTQFLPDRRTRTLSKTTFDRAVPVESVWGLASVLGANHFTYQEAYWFGRPGHYQTYLLAVAQAGVVDEATMDAIATHLGPPRRLGLLGDSPDSGDILSDAVEAAQPFRDAAKPNTYAVVGPHVLGWQEWLNHVGPDPTQVDVLGK